MFTSINVDGDNVPTNKFLLFSVGEEMTANKRDSSEGNSPTIFTFIGVLTVAP